MKRVCAWCKKEMGTLHSKIHSDDIITHGICEECVCQIFGPLEVRAKLMDFLDSLDAPVVLVDRTVHLSCANKQAQDLLRKGQPDIDSFIAGDVFECAYAKLPEGCGKAIHCSGCAIRNTVTDTFQTGESHLRVPAVLSRGTSDDCQEIQLLISTEKVKNVVMLRIDNVSAE